MASFMGRRPDELAAPKLWPKYNFDKLTWKLYFPVLEYRSKAMYKHFGYIYIIYKCTIILLIEWLSNSCQGGNE